MNIIKGVPVEGCSVHGEDCKCTPGIKDQDHYTWAECGDEDHQDMVKVCCDVRHEFVFDHSDDPIQQFGFLWVEEPRCRLHCPNHGAAEAERRRLSGGE